MDRQHRPAPRARAALVGLLLAALCLAAGGAYAAPARQETATPTPEPSATPTPEPSTTPTPEPSASPTIEPSATLSPAPTASPTLTPSPTAAMAAPAQTVSLAISKTLAGSDVVQVGQYLTFTIRITNTGTSVVTDLPLVDEYETDILQPAVDRTTPPPTDSAPGVLRWSDLTDAFGDLAPGASVAVTAVFRAIRIDDEVINRARVETGLGSGGGGGVPFEDDAGGTVEGGSVSVEKALVESFINVDAPVVSFTLSLRNEGFTDLVQAPLVDSYRTDLLSFISASVPPDAHDPATGELRWNNILAGLGVTRLRPQESVSFTTVYSVTAPVEDLVVNSFNAIDVEDEFGNRVASPRQAEVRIRISGPGGTATASPTPEEERRRPGRTATPTSTTTTEATATAAATPATPTVVDTPVAPAGGAPSPDAPATLPATGAAGTPAALWLLAVLAVAAGLMLHGFAGGRER